jgi:yecA family protein
MKFATWLQGRLQPTRPGPAPWWLAHFQRSPTDIRFGPAERRELDELLCAAGVHAGGAPGYTTLHGYLSAIVVGPRDVQPVHWLAHLLAATPLDPADSGHRRLLELTRRLHAHIAEDFTRPEPHLRLAALGVSQGPKTKARGPVLFTLSAWCAAFLHATALRPKHWAKLGALDDEYSKLNLIWMIGSPEGQQAAAELALDCYREQGCEEEEAQLQLSRFRLLPSTHRNDVAGLRRALLEINAYWSSRR